MHLFRTVQYVLRLFRNIAIAATVVLVHISFDITDTGSNVRLDRILYGAK